MYDSMCSISAQTKRYRGYCVRCFLYNFPDELSVKNYRIKEKHVADFIKEHFSEYEIQFDRQVVGGCSFRRPDIVIDLLTHVIIIEIDEFEHKRYDTTCEIARINELFQDFGYRVWIRFNPDEYNVKNVKVPGCFKPKTSSGLDDIVNVSLWNKRLKKTDDSLWEYLYFSE